MRQADKLHALIERLCNASEDGTVTRDQVRDAAVAEGLFRGHRFRQIFSRALDDLVEDEYVDREGDKLELMMPLAVADIMRLRNPGERWRALCDYRDDRIAARGVSPDEK